LYLHNLDFVWALGWADGTAPVNVFDAGEITWSIIAS